MLFIAVRELIDVELNWAEWSESSRSSSLLFHWGWGWRRTFLMHQRIQFSLFYLISDQSTLSKWFVASFLLLLFIVAFFGSSFCVNVWNCTWEKGKRERLSVSIKRVVNRNEQNIVVFLDVTSISIPHWRETFLFLPAVAICCGQSTVETMSIFTERRRRQQQRIDWSAPDQRRGRRFCSLDEDGFDMRVSNVPVRRREFFSMRKVLDHWRFAVLGIVGWGTSWLLSIARRKLLFWLRKKSSSLSPTSEWMLRFIVVPMPMGICAAGQVCDVIVILMRVEVILLLCWINFVWMGRRVVHSISLLVPMNKPTIILVLPIPRSILFLLLRFVFEMKGVVPLTSIAPYQKSDLLYSLFDLWWPSTLVSSTNSMWPAFHRHPLLMFVL